MTTEFKLYSQQQRAVITPANEVLYGGALGGGKSYLARVAAIVYSFEIPGLITYLFRRTFKEVLSNHIYTPGGFLEMLKPLIEGGEVVFSKSDYSFAFKNGSRIQLAHCQYESDVFQYQGAQIGFLILDEATHFTEDMVRFLRSRLRLGSLKIPEKWKGKFPKALYATNPGGVSHHYFKSGFVDFGVNTPFKAEPSDGGMIREYIPAKLSDNKVLMLNDPDYADRVKGLGDSPLIQAMLDGDWDVIAGGALSDVWSPSTHIVTPFEIPATWHVDRGYDYGSSAPAANIWFARSDGMSFVTGEGVERCVPEGSTFVIGELYFADKYRKGLGLPPKEHARRIRTYETDEGIRNRVRPGPADSSIFNKDSGSKSIADIMAEEGVHYVRSDKTPGSRVIGLAQLRQAMFNALKKSDKPHFYVFGSCFHTIRTLPSLQRAEKNVDDVDSSGEDHIYDVIRYKMLQAARLVAEKKIIGF